MLHTFRLSLMHFYTHICCNVKMADWSYASVHASFAVFKQEDMSGFQSPPFILKGAYEVV